MSAMTARASRGRRRYVKMERSASGSNLSWGLFFQGLALFLIAASLGGLRVHLVFVARELELERVILQKKAEALFQKQQKLELEKKVLSQRESLRQQACKLYGLQEVDPRQCLTVQVPDDVVKKYADAGVELASAAPPVATDQGFFMQMLDQFIAATKAQASQLRAAESNALVTTSDHVSKGRIALDSE